MTYGRMYESLPASPARPLPAGADHYHAAIFQAWACVIGGGTGIYLSGPITTGKRFVDAVVAGDDLDGARAANLTALALVAAKLRETLRTVVVDPSQLAIREWPQDAYLILWKSFIERHAHEVRFLPEWEFSLGCVVEFLHATQLGISTFTLDGFPIAPKSGYQLIAGAIAHLDSLSAEHVALKALSAGLKTVIEQR